MTRAAFITTATIRGLANKKTALEYAKDKTTFNESDLEEVYRKQETESYRAGTKWRNYQGTRCTKRLKEPESHREY